jgi:hypothetical protein
MQIIEIAAAGVVCTYSRYVPYRETRVTLAGWPHKNRVKKLYRVVRIQCIYSLCAYLNPHGGL